MPNFTNGKIYAVRNHENDMVYIGSTTQSLVKRMCDHRACSNKTGRFETYPLYAAMNEIGKEKFYIELIEKCACGTKEELTAREKHFIREYDSFNNGYNGNVAGRTAKEYHQEHKEVRNQYVRQWRERKKALEIEIDELMNIQV